ncbi:hypothetical protein V8C44DRAFT_275995 [Trichoderma aethiopicum]
MAPTSKPDKGRSSAKVDTENQLDNNTRYVQAATSKSVDNEGQLKRALVGLAGQGEEVDANPDGTPESLPFISLPYLPPPQMQPSGLAERGPIATLVPLQDTDTVAAPVAAPAAAPPPDPSFRTISRPVLKPTSTSTSKRPVYTMGSILPKGTATGVAGNFQSASVPPQRTTLSAALPKSTDIDSDSDSDSESDDEDGDDDESDDDDDEDNGKAGKPSKSSTATRPVITSSLLANQRPGFSGIPNASGREAVTTSRGITGGEKAGIAVATIGFVVVLLAMVWFCLRHVKRRPGSKPVWPPKFPSGDDFADGTRRVSSKVSDKFLSFKDRIKPGATGWSSLDDGTVYDNDKSPVLEPADAITKRGKRRTALSRVMVNPYGMVFRKPRHDSTWSDIMVPKGEKAPPMPPSPAASLAPRSVMSMTEKIPPLPPMPASVMSPTTSVSSLTASDRQAAAAVHLENARKSVTAGLQNKSLQTPVRGNTRMSDVSSLSSGFGDGDIIITPPTAAATMESDHPGAAVDSHVNLVAVRGSEVDSQAAGSRDTVYTSVSDDGRPHFRPVSAWVRQQSRRAKKAPALPDGVMEQGFDLMMPDEQEPRRVESSMWKEKQDGKEMV